MVGKTFKKTIAKATASVIAAVFLVGSFSEMSFAAQLDDTLAEAAAYQQIDILSLVMDSAQELTKNPFESLIVSNYEPYLAVYEEADAASEVVGKLYPGSYGEVVEKGEQWTKITSGDVTGYVLTVDVAFGEEAEALAEDIGEKVVKVNVESLNIRSGPDFYSDVISSGKKDSTYRIVPEGSEYDEESGEIYWTEEWIEENISENETADQDTEASAEAERLSPSAEEITDPIDDYSGGQWYRICLDDVYYGYVYADYVSVETQLEDAVSAEEEAELETQQQAVQAADQTQETQQQTQASETQTEASETQALSVSADDAYLLACLVYCEAGNQSYDGQLAVANVVLNRVKSSLFPNTISEVIYQSGQFSPASSGSLSRTLINGPTDSCIQAANDALAGNNNIGDYLFFNNFGAPSNASSYYWLGDHVFYTYNY